MPPIVALLTDFGTADHYLGSMKGAILSVCPPATLVDLVHDLAPQDVVGAALTLEASYPSFPSGTVFIAVVDPGVGTQRRGLALRAGGFLFVGPDNGIFTGVLETDPDARIHALTNQDLFRLPISPTFHGRDVFGPVAGYLALGVGLEKVGPPVSDPVRLPSAPLQQLGPGEWDATILHVDRFGNLITNLREGDLEGTAAGGRGDLEVNLGETRLTLVRTYGDVRTGEPCALIGSSGRLEVAVREGSAARQLGAGKGATVRVRRG